MSLHYRVRPVDLHAHQFEVRLRLSQVEAGQRFSLPAWIPGSYMVREFARQLSQLEARQGRRALNLRQIDKACWELTEAPARRSAVVELRYRVYAFDTSVRAAFLDATRGFFNGTSLLLRVHGREAQPHRLELVGLPKGWQVATAMTPERVDAMGAGLYRAADYDELVDHPFELGRFWRGQFKARGVPHDFIVAGAMPSFDGERLLADVQAICEAEMAFWHGSRSATGRRPAGSTRPPMDRYVFLLNAVDDGYGGLEHRASTALVAPRTDLPRRAEPGRALEATEGYQTLLGLISHEYFHTWNVKRLKPAELARIDYTQENYTELLWFFEGFTSYYDDLLLLRAGRIDTAHYLKLLAKTWSSVLATPGRALQSVAQSSFEAWTKYYRRDENTANATVSYYAKGALVALALDLTLRSQGSGSLDAVMTELWRASQGGPVTEADIAAALARVGGRDYGPELQAWVHGTDDVPLAALLQAAGIQAQSSPGSLAQRLGLQVSESALTGVQIKVVLRGSVAERAGLSPGDELLAVNGWRVRRLDDLLAHLPGADSLDLLVSRDQRLQRLPLSTRGWPPDAGPLTLALQAAAPAAALQLRRSWLGVG
jgi:predicted metalloprotease with PDZ domain